MMMECKQKECSIVDYIEKSKIFAVVRTNNAQKAVDISKALVEGGIKFIEITMSFPGAYKAIQKVSEMEGVMVAAGSVITGIQVEEAIKADAQLIVSPVSEMSLIKFCRGRRIGIVTGAATPNEAYYAWKLGVNIIKIFPAKVLGGPDYIKDILTQMPFLHLMPTGGITINNFADYLEAGAVAVGLGSAFYADETSYSTITQKAKHAGEKLNKYLENKKAGILKGI